MNYINSQRVQKQARPGAAKPAAQAYSFHTPSTTALAATKYGDVYQRAGKDAFSMAAYNMPVEMISVCNVDGELRPLRFRFEDAAHQLHTISISEIVTAKELNYVGMQSYLYLCRAIDQEREILFELRYMVRSHRWVLFRMIH